MAQPNSEQYREQTSRPLEKVASSASAPEKSAAGEQNMDLSEIQDLRESPSSCVGYGGGDSRYHEAPNSPNQGYWDHLDNEEESRFGQDIRRSDSSVTVEQREGQSSYGTVNPNARPSEAGFDSSGPGGYPEAGDNNLGSYGDATSKISGTYGRGGATDESSGYGSEVRDGVRHGVNAHGVASGAGVTDGFGGNSPTSSDIQQHQYHLTDVAPSQQKDTPYSQMLTEADGPTEGTRDHFHDGNTKGGTSVDHQKEGALGEDKPEDEGFLKRLMHKLPGHDHKHEEPHNTSDITEVGSDDVSVDDEDEKPHAITKLKDKLLPNHDKHHDELNPELYG